MTCRRVPWVHPTCTCGALLQLGVDHGDDELGNPLCPTCSGCGCEPNERNLMNEQELDALPESAVVLDNDNDAWQKRSGRWVSHSAAGMASPGNLQYVAVQVLHPVPEPDHSMCARPRPEHHRTTIAVDISEPTPQARRWVYPAGHDNGISMSDEQIIAAGGAIPEPEPTVVERAAAEIQRADERGDDSYKDFAQALADAGLLVRDGEQ